MGHCEIDKYANKSYQAMHHPKGGEWFAEDISKVSADSLPAVDLWAGGFPCQDASMSGKRCGIHGARTGLFFEFTRLLRECGKYKPRWLILENVKGLFSVGGTWDFAEVLFELAALGYGVEYALLNSSAFGVPQNRERIYIIGDLTARSTGKILSFRTAGGEALNQIIGGPQGSRIYGTDGAAPTLTAGGGGIGTKTGLYLVKENKEESGPRAVIQPDKEKIWQNGRRIKDPDEAMFTLMASSVHGILLDSRIRRLTPLEAFRLQGVPDEYFDRAAEVCSDAQLYKQAGNAITVPVVRFVGQRIMEYLETEKQMQIYKV